MAHDDKRSGLPTPPRLNNDENGPNGPRGILLQALITALIVAYLVFTFGGGAFGFGRGQNSEISTSDFIAAVEGERVLSVVYKPADSSIRGEWWANAADVGNKEKLSNYRTNFVGEDSINALMAEHSSISYRVDPTTPWLRSLLGSVLPLLPMLFVLVYFLRAMNEQANRNMNFSKTQALTEEGERPNVTFADVAGIDEAVEELQEVKDFLTDPERYQKMGAKIPRGILLVGPPGTGKTLLAKAVAGEAGVPFFSISGSDFVEMFVGVGASRVRDLFKQAKEASPAIIFVDEIDAVGRQRGTGLGGGHDEREQTLNQLLVEMDGFEDNSATIMIAATNRPDILDPALLRPGRFDRQITVSRPDLVGREKILEVHAKNKPFEDGIVFKDIAKMTAGFTGADLANLMNESALLAARRKKDKISQDEIVEAMERVIAGPERKSRIITEEERKTIAYHESGHALVGHILENSDPVHKISIISRGQALGYTLQIPEEDHFLETRDGMLDQIAVLLAGRTAEELFCTDITTGASNDLERATKLAREMVTRYGMSEELGAQVFGEDQHQVFLGRDYAERKDFSAETSKRIDDEVERIMREGHARAREVLEARREQMDTMAEVLLERETVEGEAVEALLNNSWAEFAKNEAKATDSKPSAE